MGQPSGWQGRGMKGAGDSPRVQEMAALLASKMAVSEAKMHPRLP